MKKTLLISGLLILVFSGCNTAGPEAPQLISPSDGSALTSYPFTWSAVPEATRYLVEISLDPGFWTIIMDRETTDTTYELTQSDYSYFETNTDYYWRVYAGNENTWGKPSEYWSFTNMGGK